MNDEHSQSVLKPGLTRAAEIVERIRGAEVKSRAHFTNEHGCPISVPAGTASAARLNILTIVAELLREAADHESIGD